MQKYVVVLAPVHQNVTKNWTMWLFGYSLVRDNHPGEKTLRKNFILLFLLKEAQGSGRTIIRLRLMKKKKSKPNKIK